MTPAMENQEYKLLADGCLKRVQARLEQEDPDDVEASLGDGMLTIEFAGGSKFIVSRQSATQQIWVAAGARAWHYSPDSKKGTWVDDKDGHDLYTRLSEVVSQKLGRPIAF
jgi:CyaY protein